MTDKHAAADDDEVVVPDEIHEPFERLLDFLFPKALDQLEEHGEFYPFGGYLTSDDQLQLVTGDAASDFPDPQEVIDSLIVKLKRIAAGSDTVLATGIVMDVEVAPPEDEEADPIDAVAVEMEHRTGWADTTFVPYDIDEDGQVTDGEAWGCCGEPRIFPRAKTE